MQTGLNEPRYVSVMGIRRVRRLPIEDLDADDLGLDEDDIDASASSVMRRRLVLPERTAQAEMWTGNPAEIGARAGELIRHKLGT